MSEAILEQQDIKNLEAAQTESMNFTPTWEQVAQFTKQAEEMNLSKMIQDNIMKNRDANDHEDDKVPADPQGQAEEDSYKS